MSVQVTGRGYLAPTNTITRMIAKQQLRALWHQALGSYWSHPQDYPCPSWRTFGGFIADLYVNGLVLDGVYHELEDDYDAFMSLVD